MSRRVVTIAAAVAVLGLGLSGQKASASHHHHGGGQALAADSGPARNRKLADRMAAHRGWGAAQQGCLNTLWDGESGFDQYNTYPSHDTPPSTPGSQITTAYGIPQALPAQKMAAAGADWQTSARTQIRWGLRYIATTYGSPCAALNFKIANGNKGY